MAVTTSQNAIPMDKLWQEPERAADDPLVEHHDAADHDDPGHHVGEGQADPEADLRAILNDWWAVGEDLREAVKKEAKVA